MRKSKNAAIAVLLMMILAACGSNVETAQKSGTEEEKTENVPEENQKETEAEVSESGVGETSVEQINLDNAEGSLTYVRHEVVKDYSGADAVRIYFIYTNKSDETKTAQSTFYPQIFQNGVECDMTMRDLAETNEASDNLSKELMKDASLEVAFIYALQDPVNPVILKVNDHSVENIWEGIYQEQELALQ